MEKTKFKTLEEIALIEIRRANVKLFKFKFVQFFANFPIVLSTKLGMSFN